MEVQLLIKVLLMDTSHSMVTQLSTQMKKILLLSNFNSTLAVRATPCLMFLVGNLSRIL